MALVLGIVCYGLHESAAVLIDGGRILAAAEEERFTRQKFDNGFPAHAIDYCLKAAGVGPSALSAVGFGFDPRRRITAKVAYMVRTFPGSIHLATTRGATQGRMLAIERQIRRHLRFGGPVHRLNHHRCHAASAFFPSPFPEASILTIDGVGDWEACWMGLGRGTELCRVFSVDWPQSLGHVYSAFTEYLGFQSFSDEYRVMGLAPYGDPSVYSKEMDRVFWPSPDGYRIDLDYFSFPAGRIPRFGRRLVETFGAPLASVLDEIPVSYRNVAAALQAQLEKVVCHLARLTIERTGTRDVCIAGGVGLNCVANGRLVAEGIANRIYVPPCASDSGAALGAAFLSHIAITGGLVREPLRTAALGPDYDDQAIESALREKGVVYRRVANVAQEAAQLLASGAVIGWYQGRLEFGHRALGSRSILADPRRADMKEIINAKVKFREPFRPFAPSVLAERAGEYFECDREIPFMTETCVVRADRRGEIPAVVHVDNTARVQTVRRDANPRYWDLISAFDALTGVPVVLNTSFNVKGQPIVNTPDEAVDTFLATNIDALVCGEFIAVKSAGTAADRGT